MKVRTNEPNKNAEDYLFYALMATDSMSNNFQNWNMQTPSHGKHYWTAKYMNYGHNKQFKISQYTAAAAPGKINEGAHQWNKKNMRQIIHIMLSGNQEHEQ